MMRAVWYDRQGPANEVLVCGELPTPEPGTDEVRVKLEAAGVNPSDTYRRRGPRRRWNTRASSPTVTAPAWSTGSAPGAGELGGPRVWLYNGQRNGRWMGTAAEYIALNVDLVTPLPDHVSFAEGATLGVPGMTAHYCVFVAGPVQGTHAAGHRRRGRGGTLRGAARQVGRRHGDRHGQLRDARRSGRAPAAPTT